MISSLSNKYCISFTCISHLNVLNVDISIMLALMLNKIHMV